MLSVASFAGAQLVFVGEADAEYSEQITVGGFYVNICLDESLPFLDHRAKFVCGQVHAVEVGEDIAALDVLGDQTEFTVRPLAVLVVLQVRKGDFEDTGFQTFRSDF